MVTLLFSYDDSTSSTSSVKPQNWEFLGVFSHWKPSIKNGAKFGLSDSVYWMFSFQFSNGLTVSDFLRHHCFGAWCVFAMNKNCLPTNVLFGWTVQHDCLTDDINLFDLPLICEKAVEAHSSVTCVGLECCRYLICKDASQSPDHRHTESKTFLMNTMSSPKLRLRRMKYTIDWMDFCWRDTQYSNGHTPYRLSTIYSVNTGA